MLNKMIKYTMVSMILLFLLGCQTSFPVNMMPEKFNVLIHHSGGITEVGEIEATNTMISFFKREKTGWNRQYIPITFLSVYSLTSDKLNMSILPTRIYLSFYTDESKDVQYYYKDMNTEQLVLIIEQNKITTIKEKDCCIVE